MKIKMLTRSAGPNGNRAVGQIVEVDAVEGQELIDGGYAELVAVDEAVPEAPVETASLKVESEKAAIVPQKRKR